MTSHKKKLRHKEPALYRIRVDGKLNESWSEQLGGMTITIKNTNEEASGAILEGLLPDQAALAGVLDTLYELHLPILSVEYIENKGNT